jgi:hypothetical protein
MKKLSLFLVALTMMLVSCKPEIEMPTVVIKSVGGVTETTAKVVGQVTADGGAEVTERGVCWNTNGTPTILDFRVKDAEGGLGMFTLNLSNLEPQTTYYVRAYATNEAGTSYGEDKSFTTEEIAVPEDPETPGDDPEKPQHNGHEYVDLGLPSGLKWATCNVGADSPLEYGDYFAWGETTTKETYDPENCPTYELSISELQSQGYVDEEGNLMPQYDAATANWGGEWRMPTEAELEELTDNCIWMWNYLHGVPGYKVIGPNGKSIFLPAAGNFYKSSLKSFGEQGRYWGSTSRNKNGYYSINLDFDHEEIYVEYNEYRFYGRSVRPVLE